MGRKRVSGTANVLRFPVELRRAPTIDMLQDAAPPQSLVASILEERGLPVADVQAEFTSQSAQQLQLLEVRLGRNDAILHFRALLNTHVSQAAQACCAHQEAADRMVALEVRAEALHAQKPWRRGALASELAQARAEFRTRAVAARAAVDVALGVAEALAAYVRHGHSRPADAAQLALPLAQPAIAAS